MNFQKPNGKRVTEAIVSVVAVGAGMILSKGISEVIPVDNSIAKKAITGTLGLVGSTVIGGSDAIAKAGKGLCVGMAATQVVEGVSEATASLLPANDGTAAKRFVNAALGSNGSGSTLAAPRRKGRVRRRLGTVQPNEFRLASPDLMSNGVTSGQYQMA